MVCILGKMAQDVDVVVLFPSSFVGFLGFHPYMCLFENFFVTCFCSIFRNGKREERWEENLRGRFGVCKV